MRTIFMMIVVGAVIWLGWNKPLGEYAEKFRPSTEQEDETARVGEPPAAVRSSAFTPRTTPAAAPSPPRQLSPQPQRIVCYVCNGAGFVKARRGTVKAAGAESRESCPACFAQGYRVVTIPTGFEICPECQGMGKKVWTETRTDSIAKVGSPCPRCATKGYIRAGTATSM